MAIYCIKGQAATKGGQLQPATSLTFKWEAPNAPAGVNYKLIVYHPYPAGTPQTISMGTNTTHTYNGLIAGDEYKWTVEMYDSGTTPQLLGSQSALFKVMMPTAVSFDALATQNTNPLTIGAGNTIQVTDVTNPVHLDLASFLTPPPTGSEIYQWSGTGFTDITPPAYTSDKALLKIDPPSSSNSSNATVNLTVRDSSQNLLGSVTKSYVVSSFPVLTGIHFDSAVIPLANSSTNPFVVPGGTPWVVPALFGDPTIVGTFPPDKCVWSSGIQSNLTTIAPVQYSVPIPTATPFEDWIECKIPQGATINGHIATADVIKRVYIKAMPPTPVCGDNTINGTDQCDGSDLGGKDCTNYITNSTFTGGTLGCYPSTHANKCTFDASLCTTSSPSISISLSPATIPLTSTSPVTINATGGTGPITCTKTVGGGDLPAGPFPMNYYPKDANIATRFATAGTETVTIKCTDSLSVSAQKDITVTYAVGDHSTASGYDYSYAFATGKTWTQASAFCSSLQEGGFIWGLPEKVKLTSPTAEGPIWCDWATSQCNKMPPAYSMWLKEAGTLAGNYYLLKGFDTIFSEDSISSLHGLRCVK